ncbi:MAG: type II toxin-antitoxin system VapC family toxin [Vulcanococcus sp.]
MRLLLDSHVLLWWWCCPALLSSKVRAVLQAPDQPVVVSAASLWELSLAVEEGKLPELAPVIWELPQLVLDEGFALLAINAQHSLLAGHWHTRGKHPQPDAVDRLLLAQAQSEGLSLVSSDLALRGHGVPVIW